MMNPNREIERSYCGARREEEIERGNYGAGASEEARGDRAWWRRTAPSTGVRRPGTNPNRGGVVVGRRGSIVRGGGRSIGPVFFSYSSTLAGAPRYC